MEPAFLVARRFECPAVGVDDDVYAGYVRPGVRNTREGDTAFDCSIFGNYLSTQLSNSFLSLRLQRGIATVGNSEASVEFVGEEQVRSTDFQRESSAAVFGEHIDRSRSGSAKQFFNGQVIQPAI